MVVASDYLSGDLADRSRRMTKAYEQYTQLRVLEQPLAGVYLSFFLMVTLLILVSSTWMGFYLAKRITRPVQMLSVAAREIAQGRYDQRIEHEATDEFGSMIEAFNAMAAELASSRRRLERAAVDLERKNHEVEGRRRYIETILERVATGVVSIDPGGTHRHGQSGGDAAARRRADGDRPPGRRRLRACRPARRSTPCSIRRRAPRADAFAQEVAVVRDGRERHVAAAVTRLTGAAGEYEGSVLVLDDVTPLIRAQKVAAWREVARRLAHEIKNPLTPIQLSAERMRRKLSSLDPPLADLVQECTTTIIGEVESLKNLVDEFSQFARMPAPRAVPDGSAPAAERRARAVQRACSPTSRFERRFGDALPQVRVDPEQMRRVVINLVDNAIEATDRKGTIVVETAHDPANSLVRVDRRRRWPGDSGGGAREAVPAVLLDQGARQRPRPRHRPPHRRGARRIDRSRRQRAARHAVHDRTARVSTWHEASRRARWARRIVIQALHAWCPSCPSCPSCPECRIELMPVDSRRRRRTRRALLAERRAARRGVRGRGRGERGGVPRSRGAHGLRRHRARRVAARRRRAGDAAAAARAARSTRRW